MMKPVNYNLYTAEGDRSITIRPVDQTVPGSTLKVTGVFSLSEGKADLGDIVFDDNMSEWEYSGLGDLTHEQAAEIAKYIQDTTRKALEGPGSTQTLPGKQGLK